MKKAFCFSAAFLFAVSLFGAELKLETDFKDAASLSSDLGTFYKPATLNIVDTADGNKALESKRGRDYYFVRLARPIKTNENFGYTVTIIRPDAASAMTVGMENAKRQYTAMIYAKDDGNLAIYNNKTKRYVNSGIKLEVGKKYTIDVVYDAAAKTMTVSVPGKDPVKQELDEISDINRLTFSSQRTKGNITLIEYFKMYIAVSE